MPKSTRHQVLAFFLAITLIVPNPAFALRQNQPESQRQRAGLEEALRTAGPQTAQQAGLEEPWPELTYHLRRIRDAEDPDVKTIELQAISAAFTGGALLLHAREEELRVVEELLPLLELPQKPVVRGKILRVLAVAGYRDSRVQRALFQAIEEGPREDPLAIREVLKGLRESIDRARWYKPLQWLFLPDSDEGTRFPQQLLPLLDSANERVVYQTLAVAGSLLGNPEFPLSTLSEPAPVFIRPSSFRSAGWEGKLDTLTLFHPSSRVRSVANELSMMISALGDIRGAPDALRSLAESWYRPEADFPQATPEVERPLETRLERGELLGLLRRIREDAEPPADFLRALFRAGKRIVFVNVDESTVFGSADTNALLLQRRVAEVIALKEDGEIPVTALALVGGASDREFQAAIQEILAWSPQTVESGEPVSGEFSLMFSPLQADHTGVFQEQIRVLSTHLPIFPMSSGQYSGEIAFDQAVERLAREARKPGSQILVYVTFGYPPVLYFDQPGLFTRADLTDVERGRLRSVVRALKDILGQDKVASVYEVNPYVWGMAHEAGLHNLSDLLDLNDFRADFGIQVEGTPLSGMRFVQEISETHGQAWDGVIFRRSGDDQPDDPEFFAPPEEPRPEALEPEGEPVGAAPLTAAGLEEDGLSADRLAAYQDRIAQQGVTQAAPSQIRSMSRWLREAAVSGDVELAIDAQQLRMANQGALLAAALQEAKIGGTWTPPESPAPLVFFFEHADTLPWAPLVAQAGALVAAMVETSTQAEDLKALFRGFEIPESRYVIIPMDVAIDRKTALGMIRQHFQKVGLPAIRPVPLPANAPHERIEEILRGYGLRFDTAPIPRLVAVNRYLSASA